MGYRVTMHSDWIHVEYLEQVDSLDIVEQASDESFRKALADKRKVMYDYTHATKVSLNEDALKELATLGKFHGSLHDRIDVAVIVFTKAGLEKARIYKNATSNSCWHVELFQSFTKAKDWLVAQ